MTHSASARPTPSSALFWRPFVFSLLWNLPLLCLLLIPQLMRSRSGSGLLPLGLLLYFSLLFYVFAVAPKVNALACSRPLQWTPEQALATTRNIWRFKRGQAVRVTFGAFALYLLSQVVGAGFAELVPYATRNPDILATDSWVILYWPYALQAVIIYVLICVASTWYGVRMRQLAEQP